MYFTWLFAYSAEYLVKVEGFETVSIQAFPENSILSVHHLEAKHLVATTNDRRFKFSKKPFVLV